jgi:hypothetical protein
MSKITAEQLARSAIVYVRQSTSYQVANNLESQRDALPRHDIAVLRGHEDEVRNQPILNSGQGHLILRREVATRAYLLKYRSVASKVRFSLYPVWMTRG